MYFLFLLTVAWKYISYKFVSFLVNYFCSQPALHGLRYRIIHVRLCSDPKQAKLRPPCQVSPSDLSHRKVCEYEKKNLEYAGELHIIALRRRELQESFSWPKLAFCSFGVNKSISTILEYPCQLRVMISGYLILLHLLFLGSKIDMHEKSNPCFF